MFKMFEFNRNKLIYKHFYHPLNPDISDVWSMETSSNQLIHVRQQKLKEFCSGSLSPISSIPAPCPLSDTVLQLYCKQTQSSCWERAISRKTCKAQGWERTCSWRSGTNCLVILVIPAPDQPRFLGNQQLINPAQKAVDNLAPASWTT